MTTPLKILVVDDEKIVRDSLEDWFRQDGHTAVVAASAKDALRLAAQAHYDLALVDIKMPGMDGLELQTRLAATDPELSIILMTAYASVDSAIRAMKAGAYDYIVKPFDPEDLSLLVRRAGEHRSLKAENLRLKKNLDVVTAPPPLIGSSPTMKRVVELIEAVSVTDATVLVTGESGTGKELVARAIHTRSSRRYNPLIVVNCGALPEGILESELFGHEAGAFTGARARHKGKFEAAEGGTVFLDEIAELSPKVQVELLRVLEDKTVTRLGGTAPVPVDFRIIAATHRDLAARVKEGLFREDLYYRIHVFTIELPPLRDRREDIPLLARAFLAHFCQSMSRPAIGLSAAASEALLEYSWPGNVRELQNAIERAVVVCAGSEIEPKDLPLHVTRTQAQPSHPAAGSLAEAEKAHIQTVLDRAGWNISQAARILGVDRVTLYNKIRKYELQRPEDGS